MHNCRSLARQGALVMTGTGTRLASSTRNVKRLWRLVPMSCDKLMYRGAEATMRNLIFAINITVDGCVTTPRELPTQKHMSTLRASSERLA